VASVYRGSGQPAWADGLAGKALQLDGREHSYLDLGQPVRLEKNQPFSYGGWIRPKAGTGAVLSKMDDRNAFRGFDLLLADGKVLFHLVASWPGDALKVETQQPLPLNSWSHLFATYDGSGKAAGVKIYVNGQPVPLRIDTDRLKGSLATDQPFRVGKRSTEHPFQGELADIRVYGRTLAVGEIQGLTLEPLLRILRVPAAQRSRLQQDFVARVFQETAATGLLAARQKAEKLHQEKAEYEKRLPTVMIMEDLPQPRDTFVLRRGRYEMPDQNQKVQPDVPACMAALPSGSSRNRLGLARWLVDPANPLTARVTVNRFWQRYFGLGLVKTTENFGIQGDLPSHPELLDWLATEFVRSGWNVKAMQKLIVMSATYRQASSAEPALVQRDPENRLLARGPRFRLPAEVVRDNALAISGLLTDRVGGPSIKPYQPAGLWDELAGGAGEGPYVQDKGANLYRRSLYIYRKRTVPHPAMVNFDAPSREVCQVKRSRTNTPLQALELLNDVTYLETARSLAQLMIKEKESSAADRLTYAFRQATARRPHSSELQVLTRGLERYRRAFAADRDSARRFIRHGELPVEENLDPVELAAYTAVAEVILNLDETITKE
jgi:hypothetical protein